MPAGRTANEVHDVHYRGAVVMSATSALAAEIVEGLLRHLREHPEAIALLRSADLLFLPMHDLPPGRRSTIVPGKTYEYLASGRPILAAVPDGDARDILAEAGNAFICRPRDVEALARAISTVVDASIAGEDLPSPEPDVVNRYEYRNLARELLEFFEQVLGSRAT